MILLDLVDFILYFGYAMVVSAAVLAIGFPLWIASKNPKSLKKPEKPKNPGFLGFFTGFFQMVGLFQNAKI